MKKLAFFSLSLLGILSFASCSKVESKSEYEIYAYNYNDEPVILATKIKDKKLDRFYLSQRSNLISGEIIYENDVPAKLKTFDSYSYNSTNILDLNKKMAIGGFDISESMYEANAYIYSEYKDNSINFTVANEPYFSISSDGKFNSDVFKKVTKSEDIKSNYSYKLKDGKFYASSFEGIMTFDFSDDTVTETVKKRLVKDSYQTSNKYIWIFEDNSITSEEYTYDNGTNNLAKDTIETFTIDNNYFTKNYSMKQSCYPQYYISLYGDFKETYSQTFNKENDGNITCKEIIDNIVEYNTIYKYDEYNRLVSYTCSDDDEDDYQIEYLDDSIKVYYQSSIDNYKYNKYGLKTEFTTTEGNYIKSILKTYDKNNCILTETESITNGTDTQKNESTYTYNDDYSRQTKTYKSYQNNVLNRTYMYEYIVDSDSSIRNEYLINNNIENLTNVTKYKYNKNNYYCEYTNYLTEEKYETFIKKTEYNSENYIIKKTEDDKYFEGDELHTYLNTVSYTYKNNYLIKRDTINSFGYTANVEFNWDKDYNKVLNFVVYSTEKDEDVETKHKTVYDFSQGYDKLVKTNYIFKDGEWILIEN